LRQIPGAYLEGSGRPKMVRMGMTEKDSRDLPLGCSQDVLEVIVIIRSGLAVSYRLLHLAIIMFCCTGIFSLKNDTFEFYQAALFCVLGYDVLQLKLPPEPLLLGLVLRPQVEENFRRSMLLWRDDDTVFLTSPLSASLLAIAALVLIFMQLPAIRRGRKQTVQE
jgi:putative tricarboxylic transport membrane protein